MMIPRVTFDDLYPRAVDDEVPVMGIFLCRSAPPGACFGCGRPTHWVSELFETHVCSAVCDDLSWLRYWRADAAAAQRSPEFLALAEQVVEELERRKREPLDVDEWARRLAEDLAKFTD